MNRLPVLSALAIALLGYAAGAPATESARHNDVDGDGKSDLIWYSTTGGQMVYWRAGNAAAAGKMMVVSGTPGYTYDPRAWVPVFTMSDFWYDPSRIMPVVRSVSGTLQFGLFPGGNAYWFYPDATAFSGAVAHGDFNGNGIADLFYRDPRSGANLVEFDSLLHDWGASYQRAPTVGLAWAVAGVGDFDGDGRSDLLWRNQSTGANAIWRSANAATPMAIRGVSNLDWKIVAVGDFDGDGRSDIFWRNARSGADTIWKRADALTPQAVSSVTDLAWHVAATGDFNGDGRWDVMWRNSVTGGNTIWKSANAATQQSLPPVGLSWSVLM